eukprot:CFRG1373T1
MAGIANIVLSLRELEEVWLDLGSTENEREIQTNDILKYVANVVSTERKRKDALKQELHHLSVAIRDTQIALGEPLVQENDGSTPPHTPPSKWDGEANLPLVTRRNRALETMSKLASLVHERRHILLQRQAEIEEVWDRLAYTAQASDEKELNLSQLSDSHSRIPGSWSAARIDRYDVALRRACDEERERQSIIEENVKVLNDLEKQLHVRCDVDGNSYKDLNESAIPSQRVPGELLPRLNVLTNLKNSIALLTELKALRSNELSDLCVNIHRLEAKLEIRMDFGSLPRESTENQQLTQAIIDQYDSIWSSLRDIQIERIQESVDKAINRLQELWTEAHVSETEQENFWTSVRDPYTIEALEMIEKAVVQWENYVEKSKVIIRSINMRAEFLQKMYDFEVTASDPRRLRGSSLRLLEEEKFRKSAYPTLLALEAKLLVCLKAFEEENGESFRYKGTKYVELLQNEITNRKLSTEVYGLQVSGGVPPPKTPSRRRIDNGPPSQSASRRTPPRTDKNNTPAVTGRIISTREPFATPTSHSRMPPRMASTATKSNRTEQTPSRHSVADRNRIQTPRVSATASKIDGRSTSSRLSYSEIKRPADPLRMNLNATNGHFLGDRR